MAATPGSEALNVVIEKLSEICHKIDNYQGSGSDSRSVSSQTPAITVVQAGLTTEKSIPINDTSPSKKEVFKCDDCDYSSHNKHYLKQHADLVHRADRPFKCPFCDYAGKRSYALKEHLIVHSNDRPFECSHCNATFRKKGHLTNHIKMHASQWQFECTICKTVVASRDALYEHVGNHANDDGDVFACEHCLFATQDKDLIVKHIDSGLCTRNTNKPTYRCDACDYTTSKEEDLAAHKATHVTKPATKPSHVSLILKCSECGFTSLEQDVLESHILTEHINQPIQVKTVPNHKPNLLKKALVEPSTNASYMCNLCGVSYGGAHLFSQHMASHLTKTVTSKHQTLPNQSRNTCLNPEIAKFSYDPALRIFRCSICGYTCEHQRTIKSHIWKHSGHKDVGYPMFQNGPLSIYDDSQGGNNLQEFHRVKVTDETQVNDTSVNVLEGNHVISNPAIFNSDVQGKDPQILQPSVSQASKVAMASLAPTASSILFPPKISKPATVSLSVPESHLRNVVGMNENCEIIVKKDSDLCEEVVTSVTELLVDGKEVLVLNVKDQDVGEETVEPKEEKDSRKRKLVDLNSEEDSVLKKVCLEDLESQKSSNTEQVEWDTEENLAENIGQEIEVSNPVLDNIQCGNNPCIVSSGAAAEMSVVPSEETGQVPVGVVTIEIPSREESESPVPSGGKDELTKSLITICEKSETTDLLEKGQITVEVKSPHRKTSHRIGSHRKGKSGISSSLLAVIEQLRERSRSDSDHEDSSDTAKPQSILKVTRRSRSKRSSVDDLPDIEAYEHVEKLPLEPGAYRCKLCHYKSTSTNLMKQHMRLHKSKQPFECSLCEYIADTSETLQDHMLQHCKIRTYQCKLCPSTFNYKSQLRAHMRAHNETEPFTCDVCEFETYNPILFRNHAKVHKKDLHCQECGDLFTEKCEMENHSQIEVKSGGNLSCDECGLILQSHTDLRKHQKTHIKQLHCEQCNFSCSTLGRMRNHCRLHLDEKPMQCSLCDFTAISTRSLKSHMKRHINDQRYVQQPLEQYKCNLCGYVCHHLPSLKSHMWRHASETGYSYQDANAAINAAIDYENNLRPDLKTPELPDSVEGIDENSETDPENGKVVDNVHELLQEKKVIKVNSQGSGTLVTFRCCQCGFESVSRISLTAHMKHHTDIITKTLDVSNRAKKGRDEVVREQQRDGSEELTLVE